MTYFITNENQSKGPFSLDELRQADPSPETLVWREGLTDWVALRVLPEWAGPGSTSVKSMPPMKMRYLFGSITADWQTAAMATLVAASLHFLHEAIPFNKTVYNFLRVAPLLCSYWGFFQIGRAFNLKGIRQSVRWLAFSDVLAMTGWVGDWGETVLGAVSIFSGIRLLVDLWTLRTVFAPNLIGVLVVAQAFDDVNIVMRLVSFPLSSIVVLVSQVCVALLFFELMNYVANDAGSIPPPLSTPALY